MKCPNCNVEIQEGELFCYNCGTKIEPAPSGKKILPFIILGAVILVLLAGLLVLFLSGKKNSDVTRAEISENASDEAVSDAENEESSAPEADEEAAPATPEPTEEPEPPYTTMVCAPADTAPLLPDITSEEEEAITLLSAGTEIKWYGDIETDPEDEDKQFYFVKVKDTDEEGYLRSEYCIPVDFPYDDSVLDIVDVSDPLYTYEDMIEDINELQRRYPDRIQVDVIGTSWDNRDIYAVKFGDDSAPNHVMMQASIHGREYMNTQLVMRLLEYYSYYYDTGEYDGISYRDLFSVTLLHVIPMSNPDGVTISQFGTSRIGNSDLRDMLAWCYEMDKWSLCLEENTNGDFSWVDHYKEENFDLATSKNPRMITFEEYLTIWKANARGVDLNNNFNAGWDDIELKPFYSYGSYKGDYPESEPETRALASYAKLWDFTCYVSYHSMGQLIYYDVKGNRKENSEMSTRMADFFSSQIGYRTVNTNKAYNVNLGGFGDWIQLGLNKPSITIESGKMPCPLEAEEFPGIWYRHRESWAMLADKLYQ